MTQGNDAWSAPPPSGYLPPRATEPGLPSHPSPARPPSDFSPRRPRSDFSAGWPSSEVSPGRPPSDVSPGRSPSGLSAARPPSGLFPGLPSRPVYREPHPVRAAPVLSGLGSALLWFALFGSLGRDLAGYAWWTIVAAASAWIVAFVLGVLGDRGVAVGVALASGLGLSVAMAFVADRWISTYDWPLW